MCFFKNNDDKIYPLEFESKQENIRTNEATFLDLRIVVNTFYTCLCNKTNKCASFILRIDFLSSNTQSNNFYSSLRE